MDLCEYKNIFGAPNTGLHEYRVFGFAAIDVGMTILAGWFLSRVFSISFWKTLSVLVLLAIATHKLFCVDTALNKMIFG